jgi:hypothetical protein
LADDANFFLTSLDPLDERVDDRRLISSPSSLRASIAEWS